MFDSIYTGLTGLSTFSRGLSNISGNVANLNTVGYKRSVLQFQDLLSNQSGFGGGSGTGNGVGAGQPHLVYTEGELRKTGNDLDAAVDGAGYFVLQDNAGKTVYTRDGQFEFDKDSSLVSREAKDKVMLVDANGSLSAFDLAPYRTLAGTPTTSLRFNGVLSTADSDRSHTVGNLTLYDSAGVPHRVSMAFTDQTDPSVTTAEHVWQYSLSDDQQNVLTSGTLRFGVDGAPATDTAPASFSWTPADGVSQDIALDFGSAGKFGGLTSFSVGADSTARLQAGDGAASGSLTGTTYDADGTIRLKYSNGETRAGGTLALAYFAYPQQLTSQGGALWTNGSDDRPVLGKAQSAMFGAVAGGQIEASNVDLTAQFSELIVTQRGYQASSQVISTANEMLQQLFDMRSRR